MAYVDDRPGHDQRYSVNANKLHKELGWRPEIAFEDGLEETIIWYLENEDWIASIQSDYSGERLGTINRIG